MDEKCPDVVDLQASDYPDLHVVFDFFAENPQKTSSSTSSSASGDVTAAAQQQQTTDNPFFDPYWDSIRIMQESDLFLEGILLKSVDYKPNFPYIHYIIYKNTGLTMEGDVMGGGLRRHHAATEVVSTVSSTNRQRDQQLVADVQRSQGGYLEMHTFVGRRTPLLPKRPSNPNTAYVVSAFKTAGNLDNLDRTWTYWSGADYIVENIPKHLKLERLTFHKLRPPAAERGEEATTLTPAASSSSSSSAGFSYVLLCELGEALSDVTRAMEFIDTLKYRQCGVASMYVVDHFF